MEYITFTNGVQVPVLAYGCNTLGRSIDDWTMEPDGDYRPFYYALNAGYRYFDDAIDYHNEAELGVLLSLSHLKRSDFFISSKLPERHKYIAADEAVGYYINRSLERFHTDYLDMYLIHRPSKDAEGLLRAWHVLEKYYKQGKVRVIGVSNFEIPLLKIFLEKTEIRPMVNQIMINPGCWHNT